MEKENALKVATPLLLGRKEKVKVKLNRMFPLSVIRQSYTENLHVITIPYLLILLIALKEYQKFLLVHRGLNIFSHN